MRGAAQAVVILFIAPSLAWAEEPNKASPPLAAERTAPPPPAPPAAPPAPDTKFWTTLQYTAFGVGGAALLAGISLGIGAYSIRNAQEGTNCIDTGAGHVCNADGLNATSLARALANAGQWVGVAGVGFLAAGVVIRLVVIPSVATPGPLPLARALRVAPWAGPSGGGALVQGVF